MAIRAHFGDITKQARKTGKRRMRTLSLWTLQLSDIQVLRIPRAGYNLLQLSVSADNSIQPWVPEFGGIPTGLRHFSLPQVRADLIVSLLPAAVTVAMLPVIESLLSALVADSMSRDRHDSNVDVSDVDRKRLQEAQCPRLS
jgi:hypothetical protein